MQSNGVEMILITGITASQQTNGQKKSKPDMTAQFVCVHERFDMLLLQTICIAIRWSYRTVYSC